MNIFKTAAFIIFLTLAGCDQGPKTTTEDLMALDQEFSDYSSEHGYYEAFGAYLADEAVALNTGRQPAIGREAVLAALADAPEGAQLVWTPVAGDIAASGDLGYTWGRYTFSNTDEAGEMQVSHGKYFTIWKMVLDGGNTNPPPEQ